ncbi:MAG: hypothetical protein ABW188_03890 [Rhodococcus fascians]
MTTFARTTSQNRPDTEVREGSLMNVIAVDREDVTEFDDWYSREHFPERLAVGGFRNARRFVEHPDRGADRVEYFSIYETDSTDTLTSDEYLAALDSPTPRTTTSVGLFRENERTVGSLILRAGTGRTGTIALARITSHREHLDALIEHLSKVAHAVIADGSAEGVALYESDDRATSAKNNTAEGRTAGLTGTAEDGPGSLFLVVDLHGSVNPPRTQSLCTAVEQIGASVRWSMYRLVSDQTSHAEQD